MYEEYMYSQISSSDRVYTPGPWEAIVRDDNRTLVNFAWFWRLVLRWIFLNIFCPLHGRSWRQNYLFCIELHHYNGNRSKNTHANCGHHNYMGSHRTITMQWPWTDDRNVSELGTIHIGIHRERKGYCYYEMGRKENDMEQHTKEHDNIKSNRNKAKYWLCLERTAVSGYDRGTIGLCDVCVVKFRGALEHRRNRRTIFQCRRYTVCRVDPCVVHGRVFVCLSVWLSWCSLWISVCSIVYVHATLIAYRNGCVYNMRDHHHELLSLLDPLYYTRSAHEAAT